MSVPDMLIAVLFAGVTLWLFLRRRAPERLQWSRFSITLLVIDAACTIVGMITGAWWLVTCGLVLLAFATLMASRDRCKSRSLASLVLPLALVAGLSGPVDQWFTGKTTGVSVSVIRRVCHFLGMPHYRENGQLCLGDLRLTVSEFFDGPGAPAAWLSVALVAVCIRRSSVVPAALLLLASLSVFGLLTLSRGIVGVSLLQQQVSLSDWDVQRRVMDGILLFLAIGLWISADQAIHWFTSPVPISSFAASRSAEFNPLAFLWNRVVGHTPERAAGQSSGGRRNHSQR